MSMLGFFGIFGRSHELRRLDQAVHAVDLHPVLVPEAVKLTTLKLLGHADTATTARYAHLSPDPAKAAADRISGRIAAALNGGEGEVVPLTRPR